MKANPKPAKPPVTFSVFGINPESVERSPAVIICMVDEDGKPIDDRMIVAPTDWARAFAARIIEEADAVDAGQRPPSTLGERFGK